MLNTSATMIAASLYEVGYSSVLSVRTVSVSFFSATSFSILIVSDVGGSVVCESIFQCDFLSNLDLVKGTERRTVIEMFNMNFEMIVKVSPIYLKSRFLSQMYKIHKGLSVALGRCILCGILRTWCWP
jgi:hypothetical protein